MMYLGPQACSTCVDGHAHSEAVEEHLAPGAIALQVPNADCASHLVLCQLDGPLLLQQPLLHMQAVPHLHQAQHSKLGHSQPVRCVLKPVFPILLDEHQATLAYNIKAEEIGGRWLHYCDPGGCNKSRHEAFQFTLHSHIQSSSQFGMPAFTNSPSSCLHAITLAIELLLQQVWA